MSDSIARYLESWRDDPNAVRDLFRRLTEELSVHGAKLDFVVRPGVSASLRARLPSPTAHRPLFCLVDIVEDADGRWLSVCFYADTVSDPEERGNLVPSGLLDENGYCFDVDASYPNSTHYLLQRIREARAACLGSAPDL